MVTPDDVAGSVLLDGPVVLVTGPVAEFLSRWLLHEVARQQRNGRSIPPPVASAIGQLFEAGSAWRERESAASGRVVGRAGEGAARSSHVLSTSAAAERLGTSDRQVRRWCVAGELEAERAGRSWLIERCVVERFANTIGRS